MTAPPNQFDAISPTAMLVTYARQFSDIPFTTELAQLINIPAVFEQFAIDRQEDILLLAALFEAHYKAVNSAIARSESKQIVELASGLLPRGMVMSQHSDMTFVESDLPLVVQKSSRGLIYGESQCETGGCDRPSGIGRVESSALNVQMTARDSCDCPSGIERVEGCTM